MTSVDIVSLVNNSRLTRLSKDHECVRLAQKMQQRFKTNEQQLFLASFYCYLNFSKTDFVINLSDIWKWLGYARIDPCKAVLVKNFNEGIDYIVEKDGKIFAPEISGAKSTESFAPEVAGAKKDTRGGSNKEHILLTIICFKKLCMKSRTEKANEIHDYYVQLEEIMYESLDEQATELRLTHEENLLTNSDNESLVYIGTTTKEEDEAKFGQTTGGIIRRVMNEHKNTYPYFMLQYTVHTDYHIELENAIKAACKDKNSILYGRRIEKIYKDKKRTELIQFDDKFTIKHLYEEVKKMNEKILQEKTYPTVVKEVRKLKEELEKKDEIIEKQNEIIKNLRQKLGLKSPKPQKPKKITLSPIDRYILHFLEYFITNCQDNTIIEIKNENLFVKYEDYMNLNGYTRYLAAPQKFGSFLLECKSIDSIRFTLDRADKDYVIGKDNRVKGKRVCITTELRQWIADKYKEEIMEESDEQGFEEVIEVIEEDNEDVIIEKPSKRGPKDLIPFLKHVVETSTELLPVIPNRDIYDTYLKFSNTSDLTFSQFGSLVLKVPGVEMMKRGKKINCRRVLEWISEIEDKDEEQNEIEDS
jgi:hypothetical protein